MSGRASTSHPPGQWQLKAISSFIAIWLLEHLGPRYCREALAGDLVEEYHRGRSLAWLWFNVLHALWPRFRRLASGERAASPAPRRMRQLWREYRGAIAFIILMVGFRSAWADWMYVPSGSMNPTILEGDRVLVNKHVYGLRIPFTLVRLTRGENPRRGDIVVFDSPANGEVLIKRVVGVPGDLIAMADERLTVNGLPAAYAPADPRALRSLVLATRADRPQARRESLSGCTHDILLLPERESPSTFGPVVVPRGSYFMLGDNRDNSADSRYIGFVPRRNIIGRAAEIVVSLNPDRDYLPRRRMLVPLSCRRT